MIWEKYVTRRIAVQVAQAWNFGWGRAMEKVYGLSVKNTLVFRDDKKTEYYVDRDEHSKYIDGLYRLLEDNKFLKTFHGQARRELEVILDDVQNKLKGDLVKFKNNELLELYKNFILPRVEQFYIRMWTVFNIGEPLANTVYKKLQEHVSQSEADKYLLSLSSPLEPNDVINERIDLLKLALGQGKNLSEHTKRYQHIPMFDFDHEPYAEKYFAKELKGIQNPAEELAEIEDLFSNRKKEFDQIIKDVNPDNDFKGLLEFLKENVWLRDYRDMIRQKLNLQLRKFYIEIAKRLDLSLEEVATLTNQETIEYLEKGLPFPKDEIVRRNKSYLLIQKGSNVEIFSGDEAISKFSQEVKQTDIKSSKELKGIIASKGIVKGHVKIVYTNKDLDKVKEGDVLVATMTRQDFVPAIRKSVALITDEGGVTCHAAIIARELKVPCIVGTKQATKIFKDGDNVEVDSERGIIKKINN